MEPIARAVAVYLFLLLVFSLWGNRTLRRITTFDIVLLIIIGGATQRALLGDDYSMTNAGLIVLTLLLLHAGVLLLKQHWRPARRLLHRNSANTSAHS